MATLTKLRRTLAAVWMVCVWLCLLPERAHADAPVIAAGREGEVMALFRPYDLGAPVTAKAKLWNVRVEPERIVVELEGAAKTSFRLEHPDRASGSERTKSFVVLRTATAMSGPGKAAVDLLVARVRANDQGRFWNSTTPDPQGRPAAEVPRSRFRGIWLPIVVTFVAAAASVWVARRRRRRET